MKAAIHDFIEVNNGNPKPFKWTASADEILGKIARFAQRTLQATESRDRATPVCTDHANGPRQRPTVT